MSSEFERKIARKISKHKEISIRIDEFFDYVVWESITNILIETKGRLKNKRLVQLRTELKTLFQEIIISECERDVFKKKITQMRAKHDFIGDFMADYLTETIWVFRITLFDLFTPDELKGTKYNANKCSDLKHIIEEYILSSYLDKIILSNSIRIMLYLSNASYAEINEFRIHLIEVFRDALEGRISLREIYEYLNIELNKLSLQVFIRKFILSSIYGYFITIISADDYSSMMKLMKNAVDRKIMINSDLTFVSNKYVNQILDWLSKETIDPLFALMNESSLVEISPDINEICYHIREIFKNLITRKLSISSVLRRLKSCQNSIRFKQKPVKLDKIANFSDRYVIQQKSMEFHEKMNLSPIKSKAFVIEQEENINTLDLLFMSLENLANIIDEEMSHDFELENLLELIKEKNSDNFNQIFLS